VNDSKICSSLSESDEGEKDEVPERGEFRILSSSIIESVDRWCRIRSNHDPLWRCRERESMLESDSDGESFGKLDASITKFGSREVVKSLPL
jgi:hypothetical protein